MASKEPMRGVVRSAPADAPEYLVTKTSIIEGKQVNRGATVRYAGVPGAYLRPLDAKGKAIVAKVKAISDGEGVDKGVAGDDRVNAIAANLRKYSDELLNVTPKEDGITDVDLRNVGIDPDADPKQQAELLKHAEQTAKDTIENAAERGGVLLQLTGEQPSTVVPTTGPLSEANADEKQSTSEKLKGK